MHKRTFIMLVAAVAVLGLLAVPVSAAERSRTFTLAGTESDPEGFKPDGLDCSIVGGGCGVVVIGSAAYAGGLTGQAAYSLRIGTSSPQPDGVHYTARAHFVRLKTPCGSGAVDVDYRGTYQATNFDPASRNTKLVEHATFRARSGTGDLARITGGWTAILQDHNNGKTDGQYTGSMTCSTRR